MGWGNSIVGALNGAVAWIEHERGKVIGGGSEGE